MQIEQSRECTLSNNLIWLKSFGCRLWYERGAIYVEHAELRDFCALLFMSAECNPMAELEKFLNGVRHKPFAPDVYVDETLRTPSVEDALTSSGFVKMTFNTVTAGEWRLRYDVSDVSVRPARFDEVSRWSALYSAGFNRTGEDAKVDLSRWTRAFRQPVIRHWFFVKGDQEVGVCQTCSAHGVVGVYSFTLNLAGRGRNAENLVAAIHALRAKLTERGSVYVYFERTKKKKRPHLSGSSKLIPGFKIIRITAGYRRLLNGH